MQASGSPVSLESRPISIAIADFNLDGKPDVAVANLASDSVSILLGTGNGNFIQSP
ncbi:MAG: VCBS repeat-containing protein, partial [Acidobacteriota bacterium]